MQGLTPRQQQILDFIRDQIRSTGYPPTRSEICQFFGFKSPNAAEEHLRALARKGVIEMTPGSSRALKLVGEDGANDDDATLPLIGKVAAGTPILAVENIDRQVPLQADLFSPQPDYLLTVEGTSMQDIGILDGDIIAVHKSESANNDEIVVARVDDEVTVKRLELDQQQQRIRLLPENPEFNPIEIDPEQTEFAIEGLVVGVIRTSV